jgi:hypothetical protein
MLILLSFCGKIALKSIMEWKYCSMFNPHYPRKIKLSQIYLNMTVHLLVKNILFILNNCNLLMHHVIIYEK